MAYRKVDEASLAAVADAIREQTGKAEQIPFPEGFAAAPAELVELGKQTESRALWAAIQQGGARTNYAYFFDSSLWTDDIFKPVYDINVASGIAMFRSCSITDLKGILEKQGVVLNTSGSGNLYMFMRESAITHCPAIDCTGLTSISQFFYGCRNLVRMDKFILKSDGSNTFDNPFAYCESLEDLEIEGVIGQNNFRLHWSTKLSRSSIESVINALSTTTTGLSVTLSNTAVNTAFASETEWNALIATRPNWTINLS